MSKKEKNESDFTIVSTINPPGQEPEMLIYGASTASVDIAKDATSVIGIEPEPVFLEVIKETIERSKGFCEGIKFGIEIPKLGISFQFEKKHKKETRIYKKAKYRFPQKR